jgi:Protein of unknown function (DUF2384)
MQPELPLPQPGIGRPAAAGQMRRRDDVAVATLISDYDAHGGLATADELVRLMRPHWRQPISVLARWIVGCRLVSFPWRSQILLPRFQFVRPRMTPNEAASDAARALGECMQDEAVARWFVAPNAALAGAPPVDVLLSDPDAVVEAAHEARSALAGRRTDFVCLAAARP